MDNKRRVGDWAAEVEYFVELIHWEERIELCPVQRRQRRLHPLLPCDQWQLIARCCFKLCFELNTSEHWRHWHGMIWWWGARCSFKSSSEPNTPLYSGHKNVSVWQVPMPWSNVKPSKGALWHQNRCASGLDHVKDSGMGEGGPRKGSTILG